MPIYCGRISHRLWFERLLQVAPLSAPCRLQLLAVKVGCFFSIRPNPRRPGLLRMAWTALQSSLKVVSTRFRSEAPPRGTATTAADYLHTRARSRRFTIVSDIIGRGAGRDLASDGGGESRASQRSARRLEGLVCDCEGKQEVHARFQEGGGKTATRYPSKKKR